MERVKAAKTSQPLSSFSCLPLRSSAQIKKATKRMTATGLVAFTASSRAPQARPRGIAAKSRSRRWSFLSSARLRSRRNSRIRQVYKGSDMTMALYMSLEGHMLHRKKAAAAAFSSSQRRQRI